ncbi:hypothetical protein LY13_002289 [Prauserella aidingensis]|uniref:hypothetical protein n=1 Tax=Prauserella aidingensis TaxID=387890 RepID=UPI0020A429E1|nr:hypothetical protein [Prauserella aidingensis]MCP2253536.1 hypothetical protein [Prauserella aidingensis]
MIWSLVLCLAPFLIFMGSTSYEITNGVVTEYSYFNMAALAGGIAAIVVGANLLRGERRSRTTVAVFAIVLVVGALQVTRGVGALPGITGCVTESEGEGFCTPTAAALYDDD